MAIRKVLVLGDETLRKVSKPIDKIDERLIELLDDMKETLDKENGAGLSAVQVGILKRVFIMNLEPSGLVECINPEILSMSDKKEAMLEGCLSVPGKSGKVARPISVTIKYQDRNGTYHTRTFNGFEARCVCHESDHLDGILYVDRIIKTDKKAKYKCGKRNKKTEEKK